jgi:hypothetical protein
MRVNAPPGRNRGSLSAALHPRVRVQVPGDVPVTRFLPADLEYLRGPGQVSSLSGTEKLCQVWLAPRVAASSMAPGQFGPLACPFLPHGLPVLRPDPVVPDRVDRLVTEVEHVPKPDQVGPHSGHPRAEQLVVPLVFAAIMADHFPRRLESWSGIRDRPKEGLQDRRQSPGTNPMLLLAIYMTRY